MGVPGVANVAVWGMRDQQLHVLVDPERLRDRDVTVNQVVSTAGNAQAVSPLTFLEASTPGTGGFIETPQQRLQVRNVLEQLADPVELGKVPVEGTGGRLRLSDVTDVTVDHQPLIGDAIVDGGEGLLLVVEKFPGANPLEVTQGVEDALETLRPGLSGLQTDTSVFRPATFIQTAIDNLTLAIIIGGALLAAALAALLFQWRTLLVALVAVPLSLIAAALVVLALGGTINALSFAGIAVAVAVIVDEAVVGAESVARRLRERRAAGGAESTAAIVTDASAEVRAPLVYATLIALLAIVPVAVMEGRPGAFFAPMVLGYAAAVVAALLVAVTVTPALSALLFSFGKPAVRVSPVLRWSQRRYHRALGRVVRGPRVALIAAGACVLAALVALPLMGTSLVPAFKDRDVLVRLDAEPGTSATRMTETAATLARELRSVPGVEGVGAHVGRAVSGDQLVDVNSSELWVSIASEVDYVETVDDIRDVVAKAPVEGRDVVSYSTQKIRDAGALEEGGAGRGADGIDILTGVDEPLVVRVYGQDLDVLRAQAARVQRLIAGVDGVVDPRVRQPREQPSLEIEVDLERSQQLGVSPGAVRRAEATLLQGIQVGSVFEDQKVFDVLVRGVPATRASVESVRNLLIDRPGGGHIRLGEVADVREVTSPTVIDREAVSRHLDVTAGVSGRGLGAVADDIRARLASAAFPLEYHAAVLERTTGAEIGSGRMIAFAVAAAIAAFLLLQAAFRSWRLALVAAAMLPVALAGGVLAALVNGQELSLGAIAGLLAVLGIAARATVLLVRRLETLRARGMPFGFQQIEQAAADRFAPAVTTAVALALLMLPLVLLGTRPGLEIVQPMAVVVLGGVITSLLMSLFLLPALYARFGGGDRTEFAGDGPTVRQWPGLGTMGEREPVPAATPGNGAPAHGNGEAPDEEGAPSGVTASDREERR